MHQDMPLSSSLLRNREDVVAKEIYCIVIYYKVHIQ